MFVVLTTLLRQHIPKIVLCQSIISGFLDLFSGSQIGGQRGGLLLIPFIFLKKTLKKLLHEGMTLFGHAATLSGEHTVLDLGQL